MQKEIDHQDVNDKIYVDNVDDIDEADKPPPIHNKKVKNHKEYYQFKSYRLKENRETQQPQENNFDDPHKEINQPSQDLDELVFMDDDTSETEQKQQEQQQEQEQKQPIDEIQQEDVNNNAGPIFVDYFIDDPLPLKQKQINENQMASESPSTAQSNRGFLKQKVQKKRMNQNDPSQILDMMCIRKHFVLSQCKGEKDQQENQQINGVIIGELSEQTMISIVDKDLLIRSKLPPGIILRCFIRRSSSGFSRFSPQYDLYLVNGLKHVLSAKKYPMRNRQVFKFSSNLGQFQDEHISYTLNANVGHNIYWLLSYPPTEKKQSSLSLALQYNPIESTKQARPMSVLLSSITKKESIKLVYGCTEINFNSLNKNTKWSLSSGNIELEADAPVSDKNFALQETQGKLNLRMYKQSKDLFQLHIQHPLSPLQAMAIAMTRFDAQLK